MRTTRTFLILAFLAALLAGAWWNFVSRGGGDALTPPAVGAAGTSASRAGAPVTTRPGDTQLDAESAMVRGIVRDPQGQSIAGASVVACHALYGGVSFVDMARKGVSFDTEPQDGGTGVRTGADGSYELRGVEPGVSLRVLARAKGFVPGHSAPFVVEAGATRSGVDVQLSGAGRIRVTVRDAAAFTSVRVTCEGPGEAVTAESGSASVFMHHEYFQQALRNGSCMFGGLRPGRWRVEVMPRDGSAAEPRTVEVVAGVTTEVER